MSKTYSLKPTWAGHGVSGTHGFSNGTYGYNASYPAWQAGYSSSRFHVTAWEFDTSAVQAAIDRGANVTSMYFELQMSKLQAYTSWSLAYKARHQTDGLAGTFTRLKKTQDETYSAYGDYLTLVRSGTEYGCTVVKEGTNDTTTSDWIIRIPIPVSGTQQYKGVPLYGLTLSSYNSSTTSRRYNIYESLDTAVLVIETDEVEHTLSYDANGGTGAPGDQIVYSGGTATISSVTPTWTGHEFKGWSTSASAVTASYQPGGSITVDRDIKLYAVWSTITYKVTYDANGGTGAPSSQTKTYGVSLKLSENIPSYTGKNFVEWNTASDGSGTSYNPSDTYAVNANMKLYAIWQTITYTVTYNANEGTGAPAYQVKKYNISLTLSSVTPTRPGYVFDSWNTNEYGSGQEYHPGDTYTVNADLVLYAQWSVAGVEVSFNANGGYVAEKQRTVYPGIVYGTLPVPTWENHTFIGWFTERDGGDEVTAQTVVTNGNDHTLFAQWEAAPSPGRRTALVYYKKNGVMHQVMIYYRKDGSTKAVQSFYL